MLSPADALGIVNYLNAYLVSQMAKVAPMAGGEGEGEGEGQADVSAETADWVTGSRRNRIWGARSGADGTARRGSRAGSLKRGV